VHNDAKRPTHFIQFFGQLIRMYISAMTWGNKLAFGAPHMFLDTNNHCALLAKSLIDCCDGKLVRRAKMTGVVSRWVSADPYLPLPLYICYHRCWLFWDSLIDFFLMYKRHLRLCHDNDDTNPAFYRLPGTYAIYLVCSLFNVWDIEIWKWTIKNW